jgi:hypothetical protein
MGFVPQGDSMRVVSRRVFAVVAAFVLAVASFVPVTAQSSDSVVVTGSIVLAPLSITVSNETIAFGALDYRATPQTPTASATGFLADGNNGALWVANTPVSISVVSPLTWSATVCINTSSGLPVAGLYGIAELPTNAAAANLAYQQSNAYINTCGNASPWTLGNAAGEQTLTRFMGTWVQITNPAGPFSATLLFSVSN